MYFYYMYTVQAVDQVIFTNTCILFSLIFGNLVTREIKLIAKISLVHV